MFSHTKWIVAVVLGALTALGGLLLAAGGGEPLAPESSTAPAPRRAPPPPEPKEPPEPEWMTKFRKAYQLADGQYVKRVARPFPPERMEFYLKHLYKTLGTEREEKSRRDFSERSDFSTLFVEQDGRKLSYQRSLSSAPLPQAPKRQRGENLLAVEVLIGVVTGREEPEVVIDPKSKDDPLFENKNLTISGDFVIRRNAPLEKLVPQLEKILRDECKLDVRLTMKDEEQAVYIVGGMFKLTPPEWRRKEAKEVDVYATEEGLNKEYKFANFKEGRKRAQAVKTVTYSGAPTDFVRFIGYRIKVRMVWDTELPDEPKFSWHSHTVRNPTKEDAATDVDPEKVLKVVTEQTGLTFKKETRKVAVLYVSVPEKK